MTSLPMIFLLECGGSTRQRGGGKNERFRETIGIDPPAWRVDTPAWRCNQRETPARRRRKLANFFYTPEQSTEATRGSSGRRRQPTSSLSVRPTWRQRRDDSTWYVTPQRRDGETSKTLDVQLGFGRDRKPKRRRNDMDKKLRLPRQRVGNDAATSTRTMTLQTHTSPAQYLYTAPGRRR